MNKMLDKLLIVRNAAGQAERSAWNSISNLMNAYGWVDEGGTLEVLTLEQLESIRGDRYRTHEAIGVALTSTQAVEFLRDEISRKIDVGFPKVAFGAFSIFIESETDLRVSIGLDYRPDEAGEGEFKRDVRLSAPINIKDCFLVCSEGFWRLLAPAVNSAGMIEGGAARMVIEGREGDYLAAAVLSYYGIRVLSSEKAQKIIDSDRYSIYLAAKHIHYPKGSIAPNLPHVDLVLTAVSQSLG